MLYMNIYNAYAQVLAVIFYETTFDTTNIIISSKGRGEMCAIHVVLTLYNLNRIRYLPSNCWISFLNVS